MPRRRIHVVESEREHCVLFPVELYNTDVPAIPGLTYLRDFVTEAVEADLVRRIDAEPWDTSWDRRRQLFGETYGPGEAARPIPVWGRELAGRLHREGWSERRFDQMLVNEYQPGQGIALHRDYLPFDRTVVALSLLSAYVMEFRQPRLGQRESLLLERRSLVVLSDAARYEWQHGIARRKNDRWQGMVLPRRRRLSITFRLRKYV
jgi:alkylated DNA repair dioxygenase AlkB